MVDEADTIFGTKKAAENNEDVRGIINAGHQRNRPYVRWDITSRSRELCPTFAMVMLAAIGGLPDTIMDRAIDIRMRRRSPGEKVAPFRTRRDAPPFNSLRDQLHGWVRGNLGSLQDLLSCYGLIGSSRRRYANAVLRRHRAATQDPNWPIRGPDTTRATQRHKTTKKPLRLAKTLVSAVCRMTIRNRHGL
jgi:hypothetical protein